MVMLWLLVAGCLVGLSSPLVAAQSSVVEQQFTGEVGGRFAGI